MSSIVVKIATADSLRRFEVPTDSFTSFYAAVVKTLALKNVAQLSYTDADGDSIVFDSTEELKEAILHASTNGVLRVAVRELVADVVPTAAPKQATTKVAKAADKRQQKFANKLQKVALKTEKAALKHEQKLVNKQEKLVNKQAKLAQKEEFRAAQAVKRERVAQLQALRKQVQALPKNSEERIALVEQLKAARASVVEANQSLQALKSKGSAAPAGTQAVTPTGNGPLRPLVIARARFEQNGLKVAFITPQKMAELKAQGRPALQNHRKALINQGFLVLPPAFVKRARALKTPTEIEALADRKSKHLLAKGKGDVNDGELLELRAQIESKQLEAKAIRQELAALRQDFKKKLVVGESAANVATPTPTNTPVA